KYAPGLHRKWILEDVLVPLAPIGITISVGSYVARHVDSISRLEQAILLGSISVSATVLAATIIFWGLIRSKSSG
ncbi:hypothetical protein R0J91_17210, partial [Micrococcus sp. SIMBA_131]